LFHLWCFDAVDLQVKRRPYSIVLLDEVEKAHKEEMVMHTALWAVCSTSIASWHDYSTDSAGEAPVVQHCAA
jgi:hypothetical protein